jgi:hypothetical protein
MDSQSETPRSMVNWVRTFLSSWIWRIEATAIWVWLLGSFTPTGTLPAQLHQVRFPISLAALVGGQVLYLVFKQDRGNGCLAVILFPLYVVLWPIWALILMVGGSSSILSGGFKQTQQFFGSLLPYVFTAVTLIGLASLRTSNWYDAFILIASVDLCLVILSLVAWVFQPLPWIRSLLAWAIKRNLANAALQSEELLIQSDAKARQSFTSGIKSIVSSRLNDDKLPATPLFEDQVIIAAFARKFGFSILHASFIFGLIHFALNNMPTRMAVAYSGLPLGTLGSHWLDYAYYGLMTLISGNASVDPLTNSARLAVAANAIMGVLFLVILVTTYSMVTRDKAKKTMDELLTQSKSSAGEMERMLLRAMVRANAPGVLDDELAAEFGKIKEFKGLDLREGNAYRGILALGKAAIQLERDKRIDDLALVQRVRFLSVDPVPHFARFGEALLAAGADDADTVLLVIRKMP